MTIKNTKRQIVQPLLFAAVLILGIYLGRVLTVQSHGIGGNKLLIYPQTNKIEAMLNLIRDEYVDTINKDQLVESIIPELLKNLDPHTVYIPAKDLQSVNEELDGNFGGIGVQFSMQTDTVLVISVISGGPSEKVGILPGDRIVSVNDTIIAGVKLPSNDVVKKLKGPIGTKVKVGVIRRNLTTPLEFEITRGLIPVYSVDVAYMITNDIGYIKINRFARTTYNEFITGVAKLKAYNCKNIIIDLRGNSGGYLDIAYAMINEFLGAGEMIVYTEGKSNPRNELKADGSGSCMDTKVAVLIDEFSASASEIFAGAIQDNDRGAIIGRRSFGKGLVQEQIPLPDGSAIRLTVARYYTPSGRCIQKSYENGIENYYHDIMERFENGEFYQQDSIHFNDSLAYKTKDGRVVYGGGGIMPDIFVPRDTSGYTPFYYKLRESGIIYQFSLEYADKHRDKLAKFIRAEDYEKELPDDYLKNQLISFLNNKKIKFNNDQYILSQKLICTDLRAYIARNIIDNDGFYPIILKSDEIVIQAIKSFENSDLIMELKNEVK
ncbi:MAG: S41 family peptidase [Bacteroidales bacterium]|nr:S41 family peptidase [Bacteroidales bacterium]